MGQFSILAPFLALVFFISGCAPQSEVVTPKDRSAEAKALAEATTRAAMEQPAEALALVESLNRRNDVSSADRAAALKAQQEALKKLAEDAAAGNAQAQSAIDRYRASK